MTHQNMDQSQFDDPKDKKTTDTDLPTMKGSEEDENEEEDDDDGYTILPSNDSGITNDDNAATGRLHEREGD